MSWATWFDNKRTRKAKSFLNNRLIKKMFKRKNLPNYYIQCNTKHYITLINLFAQNYTFVLLLCNLNVVARCLLKNLTYFQCVTIRKLKYL